MCTLHRAEGLYGYVRQKGYMRDSRYSPPTRTQADPARLAPSHSVALAGPFPVEFGPTAYFLSQDIQNWSRDNFVASRQRQRDNVIELM